ncbi:hypothetical protein HYU07_05055 [Candidatus Woesearchaeota archaeon]|nr:hypothetical protein [Candidatus Woesearchaeota archaeon]
MFEVLIEKTKKVYSRLVEDRSKSNWMYDHSAYKPIDTSAATGNGWLNRQAILYALNGKK